MRTQKVKSSGRFGSRYGTRVRKRITQIEAKQRKKQSCPYCTKKGVKRLSKGIWNCKRCGKTFASSTYCLNK